MSKTLQLTLSDEDFAWLEVLATGLLIQECDDKEEKSRLLLCVYRKNQDDFAPAVKELLCDVISSLVTGITRNGSWERDIVDSLTGWDGTYNPGLIAECIESEAHHIGLKITDTAKTRIGK
tara:strand:+ start:465 stop:827 length:363 start_codon:yes stop_codon:yes gene_type:complete